MEGTVSHGGEGVVRYLLDSFCLLLAVLDIAEGGVGDETKGRQRDREEYNKSHRATEQNVHYNTQSSDNFIKTTRCHETSNIEYRLSGEQHCPHSRHTSNKEAYRIWASRRLVRRWLVSVRLFFKSSAVMPAIPRCSTEAMPRRARRT
jgi:hypothetical protein